MPLDIFVAVDPFLGCTSPIELLLVSGIQGAGSDSAIGAVGMTRSSGWSAVTCSWTAE